MELFVTEREEMSGAYKNLHNPALELLHKLRQVRRVVMSLGKNSIWNFSGKTGK